MKTYAIPGEHKVHRGYKPEGGVEVVLQDRGPDDMCQNNGDGTGQWIESEDLGAENHRGPLSGMNKRQKIAWVDSQNLESPVAKVFRALIRNSP